MARLSMMISGIPIDILIQRVSVLYNFTYFDLMYLGSASTLPQSPAECLRAALTRPNKNRHFCYLKVTEVTLRDYRKLT